MGCQVVIWTENYFPTIGGTEIALKRQAEVLQSIGSKIDVITPDSNAQNLSYVTVVPEGESGVTKAQELITDKYTDADAIYVSRIFRSKTQLFLRKLVEISKSHNTFLRIPTTGDVEEYSHYDLRKVLNNLDFVLSLNEYTKSFLRSNFSNVNIVEHRNGVPSHLIEYNFDPNGPLVFAGRLVQNKGIFTLVNAWEKYKSGGGARSLDIYAVRRGGKTPPELLSQEWRKLYDVTLKKSRYPLWSYIDEARTVIIPSRREGHSNLMLESMASSVPIIGSNIPGLKKDILRSGCGLLIPPKSVSALVRALWFSEKAEGFTLEEMGRRGKKFVESYRLIRPILNQLLSLTK